MRFWCIFPRVILQMCLDLTCTDLVAFCSSFLAVFLFCKSFLNRRRSPAHHCYYIIYQGFVVRPLLREPRPQVHYKSQPDAKARRETQKSTNVKSLTKIE